MTMFRKLLIGASIACGSRGMPTPRPTTRRDTPSAPRKGRPVRSAERVRLPTESPARSCTRRSRARSPARLRCSRRSASTTRATARTRTPARRAPARAPRRAHQLQLELDARIEQHVLEQQLAAAESPARPARPSGSQSITATVRVTSGTYDGGCRTYNPSGALGDGSQEEGQDPAFRVENGATLRNAILGNNGVDGVHFYNGGNLSNFRWTNVGEDAFTVKSSGTVNVSGVTGVEQRRQVRPGQCGLDRQHVELHRRQRREVLPPERRHDVQDQPSTSIVASLSNMGEGIFRTDSSSSMARTDQQPAAQPGSMCIGPWAAARARATRVTDRGRSSEWMSEGLPGVETPPAFCSNEAAWPATRFRQGLRIGAQCSERRGVAMFART